MNPDVASVIATVAVGVAPLPDGERTTRRDRERAAAQSLVRLMTGNPHASITHTPDGAPHVDGFHISLSHSRTHIAVALSRDTAVGIDIEPPSPRVAGVARRVMRPDEPQQIDPLRCWTAKEAVFKCAGIDGLVLSDICLDADAERAFAGGRRFAVYHPEEGMALAIEIEPAASDEP